METNIQKMQIQKRIDLLIELGDNMQSNETDWQNAKEMAAIKNGWFIPNFIEIAVKNITEQFLQQNILENFINQYQTTETIPKKVGIVMAGNIPLVGFHDFLCVFLSGHIAVVKLSEKDEILFTHLYKKLISINTELENYVKIQPMLKNCDAYIATGSNNTARYFEQYFGKYPNIIRKNKTSVAILTGQETTTQLEALATDVHLFFGLGCRNVTKIYVPNKYDFVPMLNAFRKYNYFADHHKFKNNYDYNLAIHILNNSYYMTNDSILLIEDERLFSPISQLHYSYYNNIQEVQLQLNSNTDVQCIIGNGNILFGKAQQPSIVQFADGINTMEFLQKL